MNLRLIDKHVFLSTIHFCVTGCSFTGIWMPRVSQVEGKELPSPRLITVSLINDKDSYNQDYTLLLPQFGQFLTHDLTHSVDNTFGKLIVCNYKLFHFANAHRFSVLIIKSCYNFLNIIEYIVANKAICTVDSFVLK